MTFGSQLSIVTDAGTVDFTNYNTLGAISGYVATEDPATGLASIAFFGTTTFQPDDPLASGPQAGEYDWRDPGNWTNSVPSTGGTAIIPDGDFVAIDDVPNLSLASLVIDSGSGGNADVVITQNLTVASFQSGFLTPLSVDTSLTGRPATFTIDSFSNASGFEVMSAEGQGALVDVAAPVNATEEYDVGHGGKVELASAPSGDSFFVYDSGTTGDFAFVYPGPVITDTLQDIGSGDILEMPGTAVSQLTFPSASPDLVITTDAGTFDFTIASFGDVTGFTSAHDPSTGLVAITFFGPTTFEANDAVQSGPETDDYLWSDPLNWSNGVPVNGGSATIPTGDADIIDDVPNLSLAALTIGSGGNTFLTITQNLTVGSLQTGFVVPLTVDTTLTGKPATFTIDSFSAGSFSGGFEGIGAEGEGAVVDVEAAVNADEDYTVGQGGMIVLAAAPSGDSFFDYDFSTTGTFAFKNPGSVVNDFLQDIAPDDVLELPGNSLTSVNFGNSFLEVVTNAGTFDFTNYTVDPAVTDVSGTFDAQTGLEAIRFLGVDTFQENESNADSAFLWSNPANWSTGIPPAQNQQVVAAADTQSVDLDDIPNLSLANLTLQDYTFLSVTQSLTIGTLTIGGVSSVIGTSLGSGPVNLTVGTITGGGAAISANDAGQIVNVLSSTDPGESYQANNGGEVVLTATPSAGSTLAFGNVFAGPGIIALEHPAADNAVLLGNVRPGAVLELPGSVLVNATIGASSITITTNAGSFAFTNVAYATVPAGYTVAIDPATGLLAITFTSVPVAPSVAVSVASTDVNVAAPTTTVHFAFSSAPTVFSLADTSAIGGVLSNLQMVDANDYSATFTANPNIDIANAQVSVTAASWQGSSGLAGKGGSTPAFVVDTVTPGVTVTISSADVNIANPTATVTFGFSEAPTDFTLANHTSATGGVLTALHEINATTYMATFTGAANTDLNTASVTVDNTWHEDNGNASSGGSTGNFVVDTIAPPVTIKLVADTGSSSTDGITANDALTGTGDLNAIVTLTEGAVTLGTTKANGAGVWTFTPVALSQGGHTITASETDLAGNTGTATLHFTYNSLAPTGFRFAPDTAHLLGLEGASSTLVAGVALGTVVETGGASGDSYSFSLAGAAPFVMGSSNSVGTLSTAAGGAAGKTNGQVYALNIKETDTTNGQQSSLLPFDVVVGSSSGDTINLAQGGHDLGISSATPTFVYGLGGADLINATGMTGPVWMAGGSGADTFTEGTGPTTYLYAATSESTPSSSDLIMNFNVALDRIDLTGIGATPLVFQASKISGNSISADTIGWKVNGQNTALYVNTSGATELLGSADMKIQMRAALSITSADVLHH